MWKDIINEVVKETAKQGQMLDHYKQTYKILVVGCGISRLSEELYDDAFGDITSIDFSYTAVKF